MLKYRILIVGGPDGVNLESSYQRAFESLGHEVTSFSVRERLRSNARFGRLGQTLGTFVPVVPWIRKTSRELVVATLKNRYDLIVVFGSTPVLAGALAQIRASVESRVVLVWPDTLLNLNDGTIACLPLFDSVFTYSLTSVPLLQRLHAPHVLWLPLAGDTTIHKPVKPNSDEARAYQADVTFVGGWRPEREDALSRLTQFKLKIWGPEWGRRATNVGVRKAWQGRPLLGPEFAKAVSCSRINLNIIDDTNYPAANMRFFEIPTAAGAELCSHCPEMEAIFREDEHIFYYKDAEELPSKVRQLLNDPAKCRNVARHGYELVVAQHTYVHRAHEICASVSEDTLATVE